MSDPGTPPVPVPPGAIDDPIAALRERVGEINRGMLGLISERAALVLEIRAAKERLGLPLFSPEREQEMLEELIRANPGPFTDATVRHLFLEIFRASLDLMQNEGRQALRVSRRPGAPDVVIEAGGHVLGGPWPAIIAGPCAVETEDQVEETAAALSQRGVRFLRAGAWKPRTSPYEFQGLGVEGARLLSEAGRRHGMATVTEVVDSRSAEAAAPLVDILQIGTRNMSNFELLKTVAGLGRPILLKRGFAATLEEYLQAAEYVAAAGNERLILCERGIRTFERATRFTLDVSAVPILRQESRLPVVVDVSHAAGRRDLLPALARASLAAGASGVMIEVHPRPQLALSDARQQLDFAGFDALLQAIRPFLGPNPDPAP